MTDVEALARALRRVVFTHKLLTVTEAERYCDLVGLSRAVLCEK